MTDKLQLTTACCNRKVTSTPFLRVATSIIARTCPKCRVKHLVKVRPIRAIRGGFTHEVTWTPTTTN